MPALKTAGHQEEAAPAASLPLESFLPYRLNVASSLLSRAFSQLYAERFDISIPQWRIMATLGQHRTMTQKDICAHTHLEKSKASRAIADLGERGLVLRKVCAEDRRAEMLTLSAAGRRVYAGIVPLAQSFGADVDAQLTPAQRDTFADVLEIIIATAKKNAGDGVAKDA